MPYETARLLAYQSFQQWISTQLFSFGWFFQVGLLIVAYTVWIKLVDKSRIKDLLLFGSLCAVAFGVMESLFVGFWGLWEFKINLFPMQPPHFVIGYTLGPIMHMLVQQYTSSWKKFLLWDCVGSAVMVFGILPIYSLLGILQLHNWNYFYHFLLFIAIATTARGFLLWFTSIEQSQRASSRGNSASFGLQPAATKPVLDDNDGKTDSDK